VVSGQQRKQCTALHGRTGGRSLLVLPGWAFGTAGALRRCPMHCYVAASLARSRCTLWHLAASRKILERLLCSSE
jgi:hypothetical protein